MIQSAHVSSSLVNGVPIAVLTTEKVGDYECHAIELDLTKLANEHRQRYAVDFTQVRLLSSVGIGLLLKLNKMAAQHKPAGKVVFFSIDPQIFKLLQMTRLDKGLAIQKDRDAAVKFLQELK
jgi:anti-anti-sigma factor